jgi:signal transduction histidine kinase/ligand-binding sensor domain-containing protein
VKPRSKPVLALVVVSTLAVVLWPPRAHALDPELDISQYAHRAWTFGNGFLNGAVNAITQTPDGYLWFGTQSGVVRFDGVRTMPLILPAGQQLPSTAVSSLLAARDGTLWIGTLDGLVSWNNGQLIEYPALVRRTVITLLEGHDGTVWAGSFGGATGELCAIRSGTTTCYGDDGRFGTAVESLYEGANGSLWVGAATGLWRWNPGPPTLYLAKPVQSAEALTQGDHPSGVMAAIDSVWQIVDRKAMDYALHGVPSPLTAARLLRDHNGGLWIGTIAHGLVHSYKGKTSVFTHKDGLSSDLVLSLFEDREGTIWVVTTDGLDQFRELPVTPLTTDEGLSSATARSILAARDGSIWIGTADGLNRWQRGRITIYRTRSVPGLPDDSIQSLFEDNRGRIWVSGFRGLAVFENGTFTTVPSVPSGITNAIVGDNHGGLWLSLFYTSHDYGIVRLVNGKVTEEMPWQKLGGGPGTGLVAEPDGGVWTGLLSGGVAFFQAGEIRHFPLGEGRSGPPKVLDISRDRDGALWVAAENGLSRITDGHIETLTTANGLPCNTVHWIIEDDLSSYWLYTRCGLIQIARTELDAWAADPKRTIHATTFDSSDGVRLLPILTGYRPAVTKSSDGKIWFVNGATLGFINPRHIITNPLPPPVHIEQIRADGKTYDPTGGLHLAPHVRDLTIDYTALSLVAPEKVHFRYKLEGQDPDWREVVNDREVQYSNLPPGNYRFRVIASNSSGLWNEQGDILDFSIIPAYYQTNGFRALAVAALVGLLWGLYQYRVVRLAHQFNIRLEERVGERTRIARDLHDTMLQRFQGLLFELGAVSNLLPKDPLQAKANLDDAVGHATDAIVEGRNAIQDLRSSTTEKNDLAMAIKTLGKEVAASKSGAEAVSFRVEVEGASRDLQPIVRDEIYRIAGEAVRNAFKHSGAAEIEVQIRYGERQLQVRVRDNGIGIAPEHLKERAAGAHFGLGGMRERAKLVKARLDVWSETGAGTEVELTVPASVAYLKARRAWFPKKEQTMKS